MQCKAEPGKRAHWQWVICRHLPFSNPVTAWEDIRSFNAESSRIEPFSAVLAAPFARMRTTHTALAHAALASDMEDARFGATTSL